MPVVGFVGYEVDFAQEPVRRNLDHVKVQGREGEEVNFFSWCLSLRTIFFTVLGGRGVGEENN